MSSDEKPSRPGFIKGLWTPVRGARLILGHKRLAVLSALPVAVNALLYAGLLVLGLHYFQRWIHALLPTGQAWYWAVLSVVLLIVLTAVLILAMVVSFVAVAAMIGSPFYDALSQETEQLSTGLKESNTPIAVLIREIARGLWEELKKILFYLAAVVVLLVLQLVPVIGQAAYVAAFFVLSVIWLGLSFLDFTLSRHGFRLKDKLRFIRRHFKATFGYGLGVFGAMLIPFLNLVVMPAAVVGGTLLCLEAGMDKAPEGK